MVSMLGGPNLGLKIRADLISALSRISENPQVVLRTGVEIALCEDDTEVLGRGKYKIEDSLQ